MTTPVKIQRNQKTTSTLIGRKGKIVTWTTIRVPSKIFSSQAPYPVVIVKLETGTQIIGQLVDYDQSDLKNGSEVIAVLRRCGNEDNDGIIH